MKSFLSVPVWTNIFFLIPVAVAWKFGMSALAIFLVLMTLISLIYHCMRGGGITGHFLLFAILDIVLAVILVLWGIFLVLATSPFTIFSIAALIIFIAALAIFRRQYHRERYPYYHGLWHFLAAAGITCCVLGVVV